MVANGISSKMAEIMFDVPITLVALLAGTETTFQQAIPGTSLSITMMRVSCEEDSPPIWVSRDEICWDHYDALVYQLDVPKGETPEDGGVTRPTKPYLMADRGWGHAGYPALSVNHTGADAFCQWLTAKTGRTYRLPTESEWLALCATSAVTAETAPDHAWVKDNARRTTHPVGTKKPDANGLHDFHGNVAEWVTTKDGSHVLRGATFLDASTSDLCTTRRVPVAAWNDTDPQIPKSIWWLSDAPFAGFRVVCEATPAEDHAEPLTQDPETP